MEKEEASPTGQTPTVPHSHQVKADSEADDLSQLQSKTEQQNDPSQPDTAPEPVSGQKAASVTHQTENPSDKATAEGTGGDGEGGGGEEVRVPREHGRLDVLLSQIPKKAQHGLLRQCDLILTCIDANQHFIAMGTNIGLTFLYSRCQHTVQRLRSESSSDVVSCVQLHEGIDHQVAVGTASGALSIFFIPGAMSANTKQLEKFEVKSMHRYYITCVVWSTNGMKLFSGDKSGQVVVTEVDFYQGQCKSSVLLVEPPTEIVQLHYNHRVLLVSTRHRSFLCRLDTTGHTTQIGQKDRKVQGNYGAVLLPGLCKTEDAQLYAVRPGCRIWLSDIHGNVLNTLMFKELVGSSHPDIPLLHPSPRSSAHNLDLQFGRVLMYSGDQLVTYNASTLFILHPHRSVVVASQSQLGGIVDVAVYQDEIFILRRHTDSAVIRIAYQPEALLHAGISPDKPLDTSSSKSSGSSNGSSSGEKGVVEEEENKAKQFFKKTFLSPFKKLDTFLQEHAQNKEAELDLRPVIRSDPEQAPVKQSLPEQAPVKQSLPEQAPVKQSHLEQTPVMRSHPEQASPQTGPPPSGPLPPSQDSSPDLPPVVPLDFPDLTVRIFAGANKKGSSGSVSSPGDVQSPDSAHSALSVFAEEAGDRGVESTGPPATGAAADAAKVASEGETEESSGQVKNNDNNNDSNQGIIFSHHMQKKRGKKKKAKGKPDKDSDTLSQSSLGSQTGDDRKGDNAGDHTKGDNAGDPRKGDHAAGGHPKEIDEVLRRAEEALNNAGKLLNTATDGTDGDTDSTSASTTTITQQTREGDSEQGGPSVTDGSGGEEQKSKVSNASVRAQTVGDEARGTQGTTTHAVSDVRSDETDSRRSGLDESKTSSKQQKLSSEQQKLPSEQQKPSSQQHTPVSSPLAAKKGELDSASQRTAAGNNSSVPAAKSDSRTPFRASPKPGAGTSPNSSRAEAESRTPPSRDKDGRVLTPKEGEDAMAAAERTLDSMTQRYSLPVKKQDSTDDFYSMFASPYSPTDPLESPPLTPSLTSSSSVESDRHSAAERGRSSGSRSSEGGGGGAMEGSLQKLANSWSEFTAPANIYSLALSSSHVWFTDKSENLYYSALGGVKGMVWRKVSESAGQVAVSPSGHIVWRLHRGRVFAGTKITHRRPEGLKWVEAVNNVAHIAVDDHCAWYVKTSGEVMMQRGLSKERPCFRSVTVGVGEGVGVRQVMARHGVVWALTDDMTLLVRTGITNDTPHGTAWYQVDRRVEPCLFCSVSVDSEGIGWATDVLGQVWFTDHVTPHNPVGSGKWWQVPLSECYVQAPSVVDMLRSLARRWDRRTLTAILHTRRGSIITAGDQGVWLALDHLNTLYVCRGSLQGYHWSMAQPSQMADSTMWKQVNAAMAHLSWGLVWAQQDNGELYAIPPDSSDATLTPTPGPDPLLSLAANRHSLWGLDSQGALHVRGGLGQHCPLGLDWAPLDLLQLGDVFLVHVSCNNNYVWVVDGEGRVFHRIGAAAPRPEQLNPVWLPIDVYMEIIFTKVVIGPLDWMVWAVDNRRLTYVRVGVGDDLPIGKEWIHVPGIQAMDVCVSGVGVWALNTSGELLFRYGITPLNPSGNYWKKAPGCFTRISASYEDALWAVTTAGQLVKCSCRHLTRRHDDHDPLLLQRSASVASEEGEWELV